MLRLHQLMPSLRPHTWQCGHMEQLPRWPHCHGLTKWLALCPYSEAKQRAMHKPALKMWLLLKGTLSYICSLGLRLHDNLALLVSCIHESCPLFNPPETGCLVNYGTSKYCAMHETVLSC